MAPLLISAITPTLKATAAVKCLEGRMVATTLVFGEAVRSQEYLE